MRVTEIRIYPTNEDFRARDRRILQQRLYIFSDSGKRPRFHTVDLEHLKEKEDAAIKIIDTWPRIFQLVVYRQLYALGIRISNIDSEIEKELKKSA